MKIVTTIAADDAFPAHRIAGNTYYVGSKDLAKNGVVLTILVKFPSRFIFAQLLALGAKRRSLYQDSYETSHDSSFATTRVNTVVANPTAAAT
jgi:hypothetical protein